MKRIGTVRTMLVALALSLPWSAGVRSAEGGPARSVERVPEVRTSVTVVDKVNINTADIKQLMTLEGVGRSLAEKIVEYRRTHGAFTKPEQLRKVEGVGATVWERNRERLVVK